MIAQVFSSVRVLERARWQLAYLRVPGFGEPPGAGFELLGSGFETYDAFLAARYEAEGFLVNSIDADTAAEAVKRIRRDPSHCLKPVFLLHRQALWPPISPTVRYGPSTRPSHCSRNSADTPGPWLSFRRRRRPPS